jgi:Domain of unknown function (DUF4815)
MSILGTPAGYYDRAFPPVNDLAAQWKKVLFKPGVPLQSAELNEVQTLLTQNSSLVFDDLFTEGQFLSGGGITVTTDGTQLQVAIGSGLLYALGYVHNVPAGLVDITGIGTETISLIIGDEIITALPGVSGTIQDLALEDPAVGAEAYGQAGADRLVFTYTYAYDSPNGILIATFINGQLVQNNSGNSLWDQILALLALRTYEQSGSFLTTQPVLSMHDVDAKTANPTLMKCEIDGGVGYVKGYRYVNVKTQLPVVRPMASAPRIAEPDTFLTSTLVYTLDNPPATAIDTVQATIQSGNIPMIRGSVVNGQDPIPSQYQPVASIVSAIQGMTTFVQGTDYALTGNYITWLPGGSQPSTGSSYVLVVQYVLDLTKAIRVYTSVTNESHTAGAPTTHITLSHADVAVLTSVYDFTTSTLLVEGTDYTFTPYNGHITWISTITGDTVHVTYAYWAHTGGNAVEGDFVGRDSFQDSSGDVLYYQSPTKTPTGVTVNFTSQVSFDVSGGHTPVNDTTVFISYHYALPRTDVLAWHTPDGLLYILPGVPSLNPNPVVPDPTYMPIANLKMPAESFAANVIFELYNNLTMKVTDLRTLQNQVFALQYDIAQFQLQQSALNQPTPTDKIGIFADDFSTSLYADVNNGNFAASFDFLQESCQLPRTGGGGAIDATSTVDATLYEDTYINNFSEVASIIQPYKSNSIVINQLGAVNQKATISLHPGVSIGIEGNNLSLFTQQLNEEAPTAAAYNEGRANWQNVIHNMLLVNTAPNSPVAAKIGTKTSEIANPVLNQVPVNVEWGANEESFFRGGPPPANASVVVQNAWATVLATQQIVVSSVSPTATVTVTGTNFRANDRDIILIFDGKILPLTGTGGTSQDGTYSTAVVANSTGHFTATFVVPANTPSGTHTVECVSREAAHLDIISSIASTTYLSGGYVEYISFYITLKAPPLGMPCKYVPVFAASEVLGNGFPDSSVLNSISGPSAYSFAYMIAQALAQSIVLTNDIFAAAVTVAYQYTTVGHQILDTAGNAVIDAIVNAVDLTSSNVAANAAAMLNASYWASVSLGQFAACYLDPLGQTFTLNQDSFVTSVDLYFTVAPSSSNPVTVGIVDTTTGIPLQNYYGAATVAGGSIGTSGATNFAFPKPIFLKAGIEYAFVVQTQDTTAALWSAVLGQKDATLGLITNNPASGALLNSANGSTWEFIAGTDLTFKVKIAHFTHLQGIVNYGLTTFAQDSSRFCFYAPYACPSAACTVQYQYSLDGSQWTDFAPLVEVDFGAAVSGVYVRALLNGSVDLSPTLNINNELDYFIWNSSGEYVHRQFTWSTSYAAEFCNIYVDVAIPGNTTLTFAFSGDGGSTWHNLSHVTADDIQIDNVFTERHYTYDSGSAALTSAITRCVMATTANYVTPVIRNYRVIMN